MTTEQKIYDIAAAHQVDGGNLWAAVENVLNQDRAELVALHEEALRTLNAQLAAATTIIEALTAEKATVEAQWAASVKTAAEKIIAARAETDAARAEIAKGAQKLADFEAIIDNDIIPRAKNAIARAMQAAGADAPGWWTDFLAALGPIMADATRGPDEREAERLQQEIAERQRRLAELQ